MSQKLVKHKDKWITLKREKKLENLNKSHLIIREDNFAQLLKPICLRVETRCVITKKKIYQGDYAYPCYSNPTRLSPYGNDKVLIEAVAKNLNGYLPMGSMAVNVPTTDEIYSNSEVARANKARVEFARKNTQKLLRANK